MALHDTRAGLHFADVEKSISVRNRPASTGNTVLVIQHNLDVINTAGWLIDTGPEGGDGGLVVTDGTPERVAQEPESHTGRYLRKALGMG